jgi:hypothetical protein
VGAGPTHAGVQCAATPRRAAPLLAAASRPGRCWRPLWLGAAAPPALPPRALLLRNAAASRHQPCPCRPCRCGPARPLLEAAETAELRAGVAMGAAPAPREIASQMGEGNVERLVPQSTQNLP